MRRALAITVTVGLVAALAWAPVTMAQITKPAAPGGGSTPPAAGTAPASDKHMEGKVKSVDPTGKKLTLIDGTEFMIPETVKVSRTELRPGANVKVSYQEEGSQKVIKAVEVQK